MLTTIACLEQGLQRGIFHVFHSNVPRLSHSTGVVAICQSVSLIIARQCVQPVRGRIWTACHDEVTRERVCPSLSTNGFAGCKPGYRKLRCGPQAVVIQVYLLGRRCRRSLSASCERTSLHNAASDWLYRNCVRGCDKESVQRPLFLPYDRLCLARGGCGRTSMPHTILLLAWRCMYPKQGT
ncbi:hypothetical protein CC86DRAFT_16770 [Ophiobolus disseminans]|uniref:Uncharacterized protein n=1 Tax=Ophiobolus disseminans TaxID=1469910 RepID=A0A6A7ANI8_9PLEO|nr:hypothetical protein CC86DRAFT_16770 [Ophiobolus disseminans]